MRFLSRTVLFAMPLIAFACFFLGRALMTLPEDNVWLALTESFDAVFLAWLLAAALDDGIEEPVRFFCSAGVLSSISAGSATAFTSITSS